MKKKVKPTSVRFDNELLDELDQRCDKLGCSRNDFIKNSVDFAISQYSDFDFGDDDVEEVQQQEPIVEEIRLFNCNSGKMYENDKDIGDCADYHLDHGKVFDNNGKQIGIIDSKPKITLISD